ncbi:MAG TPA: U32 family peptidase, partial [Rhodocyclaceae bacterium]|nr:U32 family peptidase [Rhodocyclaceae bacterium]
LAYSARCFTARRFNLQKDACEFRCLAFPEGLPLATREGEAFLNLNGTQTQSARVYNLLQEIPELKAAGVDVLRLSPQAEHTAALVGLFRDCIDGALPPSGAWQAARAHLPAEPCNGFWHGLPGLEQVMAPMENTR